MEDRSDREVLQRYMRQVHAHVAQNDDDVDFDSMSIQQALSSKYGEQVHQGCMDEVKSWLENDTGDFVPASGRKADVLPSKWVLKWKNGKVKARVVARGDRQKAGLHYGETYAPTISGEARRMLIAVAAGLDFKLVHLDVVTAFLIPMLEDGEEIFLRLPYHFIVCVRKLGVQVDDDVLLKLHKCVYGLKQAARRFYKKFAATMAGFSMRPAASDECLFVKYEGQIPVGFIGIHVDDALVAGKDEFVQEVKGFLASKLPIKDLGPPKDWCGLTVASSADGISVSQGAYVRKLLQKFGMENCRPAPSPTTAERLNVDDPASEEERASMVSIPYREAVGALTWLYINTRPDIMFAVHQVARRTADPTPAAWRAVKRIFRYLSATIDYGLVYDRGSTSEIIVYSDSDWAGDTTRRSTACTVIMMGGSPIAWKVKLIRAISQSAMEGELIAFSEAGKLTLYVMYVIDGLGMSDQVAPRPLRLLGDSMAAMQAIVRGNRTSRSKHIEVRHFWMRQQIEDGVFKLVYVPTESNVADIGTKPLGVARFIKLRKLLMSL